jgi:uncharacterized protein
MSYALVDYPGPALASLTGIGLRFPHLSVLERTRPPLGLLELHTENLFCLTPALQARLERVRADYTFSLHGIGLSLGSAEGINEAHLQAVAEVIRRYEPALVSEHLSWNRCGPYNLPGQLPLPMTQEALEVFTRNLLHAQDVLGRPLAIENVAAYVRFEDDEMTQMEFLRKLVVRTGCAILLDLNSLHVNRLNLGEDPEQEMKCLAGHALVEYHLSGASKVEGAWVDSHAAPVSDAVWRLYKSALSQFGPRATIVEWDQHLPPLGRLVAEAGRARAAGSLRAVCA